MGARADIHWKNDVAAAVWRELPPPRRRDYCAVIPPGSPLSEPGDGLPVNGSTPIRIEETEFGFENFAVLRCRFHHLDILQLDPAGHRRAVYQWREGRWSGQWVVP